MSGYNYFREHAVTGLLLLLKMDPATPEQRELAGQVVDSIERYAASKP